jgi:hypothetical protein
MTDLLTALRDFNKDRKFNRKGPLCVALVITQHARWACRSIPTSC